MRFGLRDNDDEPADDLRHTGGGGGGTVPAVQVVAVDKPPLSADEASGSTLTLGRRATTDGGHVPFICSMVVRPSMGWVGELVQLNLGSGSATVDEMTSERSGTAAWWAAINLRHA